MHTSLLYNLSRKYNAGIVQTRASLFSDLNKYSSKLSLAAENILTEKLKSTQGGLWGEIYPWMIQELFNINNVKTAKIAKGWLSIYIHTVYIDSCIDKKDVIIKKEEILASSVLAKEGLLNLEKIVRGTKYEKIFDESLTISANYELADHLNRKNINSLLKKEKIAIEKNRIILACAGAFAAIDSTQATYILNFTRSLLLSVQYLDDITDFTEDMEENNYSYLLTLNLRKLNNSKSSLKDSSLLKQIIVTDALLRTVEKIYDGLTKTIQILRLKTPSFIDNTSAFAYFASLQMVISDLLQTLKLHGGNRFNQLEEEKQLKILQLIKDKIFMCNVTT